MARRIDLADQGTPPPADPVEETPAPRFAVFADSDNPVRGVDCADTIEEFRQALRLVEAERVVHSCWSTFDFNGENAALAVAPYRRWLDCNNSCWWARVDSDNNYDDPHRLYRATLAGVSSKDRAPQVAMWGVSLDEAMSGSSPPSVAVFASCLLVPFCEFQGRYAPVARVEQVVWLPLSKSRRAAITRETTPPATSQAALTTMAVVAPSIVPPSVRGGGVPS